VFDDRGFNIKGLKYNRGRVTPPNKGKNKMSYVNDPIYAVKIDSFTIGELNKFKQIHREQLFHHGVQFFSLHNAQEFEIECMGIAPQATFYIEVN